MSLKSTLKELGSSFFKGSIINDVKKSVKETMEDLEKKTQKIVENVVKSTIVLVMVLIGAIFALSGLGTYLTETVPNLANGLGFIVVGGALILLGLFAKLMQRE